MAGCDWVVCIIGALEMKWTFSTGLGFRNTFADTTYLRSADDMLEPSTDLVARFGGYHRAGSSALSSTDDRGTAHVLHWIVGWWRTQTCERALLCAIDGEFLETSEQRQLNKFDTTTLL